MAAADQAEGGCGVDERAAGDDAGGAAARIHIVDGIGVFLAGRGGTNGTVLSLEGHMDALGQIVGDQGRQTDAQIDDVAILELLRNALGDKAFDLRLFH